VAEVDQTKELRERESCSGGGVCVISVERNSQYDDDHGGVRQRYAQWKVEKGKERKGKKRREAKERGEERRRRSE
jgi:hypothetical protein